MDAAADPMGQGDVEARKTSRRRLIIPVALAVTAIGVLATATIGGCGSDPKPPVDAAVHDAMPDTPLV
jgi:hypothetical protein